jgi:hypothetical protein
VAQKNGHEQLAQTISTTVFMPHPMQEMPWDVVMHILSFLNPYHLCVVAQVCSVRTRGPVG